MLSHCSSHQHRSAAPLLRLLVLAMQAAIESRVPESVGELLAGMSEDETAQVLMATYEKDYLYDAQTVVGETITMIELEKDFLFPGASPILHAARCGDAGMLTTILEALRERVSPDQVRPVGWGKGMLDGI